MATDPNALRRTVLRKKAAMRAELNHQIQLDRIDWTLDVLEPAVKKLQADFAAGKLDDEAGDFAARS